MSNFSGYKTKAFSESQKFFVLDPNTGSPAFVNGADLIDQITPNSNYVYSESTRTTAAATDYAIGSLVETAGATSAGDDFAAVYLVVKGGQGDFPMQNGNDLLVIRGDEFLREQLASFDASEGSDLVAHTGTDDTVTEALNKRTIYVGSVAELEALSLPVGTNVYLTEGGRAGEFLVKTGTPPSDPQKGIYIVLANGNYAERLETSEIDIRWFGAVADGVTDDSDAIQAALDSVGDTYPTGSAFRTLSDNGIRIYFPAGTYLITKTLLVSSNTRFIGSGHGTQFVFDPVIESSSFIKPKLFTTGGALQKSNYSMRFEDFYVRAATTGNTVEGRNGTFISEINTNTLHAFDIIDSFNCSFENVLVTDFWYGTAFRFTLDEPTFAFYNYVIGCHTRNCKLNGRPTSATHFINCTFGQRTSFPPLATMADYTHMIDFSEARGCSFIGGSLEGYSSIATIKDNGSGHAFNGTYLENFPPTPAAVDCSSSSSDSGMSFYGGMSYGYSKVFLHDEAIVRGGSNNFTKGKTYSFGEFTEIELEHNPSRQSPSFKYGLPGVGHNPASGTLEVSTDSFVDETSLVLSRGATSDTEINNASYNFKVRNTTKYRQNIWITILVKLEGGEDNIRIRTTAPQSAEFAKLMEFNNGWEMWGTYLLAAEDDENYSIGISQEVGSTDPARKLKFSSLRAYNNGYSGIPQPYQRPEYRASVPTEGTWKQGEVVYNSQPAAGGIPGWVCVTAGTPGTWKAMAALEA